jgi:hypothetical protein
MPARAARSLVQGRGRSGLRWGRARPGPGLAGYGGEGEAAVAKEIVTEAARAAGGVDPRNPVSFRGFG